MRLIKNFEQTFKPELLEAIDDVAEWREVKEGEVLLDIGETVRTIPFLIKGSLKVSRMNEEGREILLYYVNAHESCAMTFTCCMQQFPSEIKAVAETDAELLSIPIAVMDSWLVKYPTWKSFVKRFSEVHVEIERIY